MGTTPHMKFLCILKVSHWMALEPMTLPSIHLTFTWGGGAILNLVLIIFVCLFKKKKKTTITISVNQKQISKPCLKGRLNLHEYYQIKFSVWFNLEMLQNHNFSSISCKTLNFKWVITITFHIGSSKIMLKNWNCTIWFTRVFNPYGQLDVRFWDQNYN